MASPNSRRRLPVSGEEINVADASQIREHMEVVGSDGGHVGKVDHLEGQRIKLAKSDPEAGGEHHYLHIDVVASVDDKVRLNRTAAQAKDEWGVKSVPPT
jgi:hypothetical protein